MNVGKVVEYLVEEQYMQDVIVNVEYGNQVIVGLKANYYESAYMEILEGVKALEGVEVLGHQYHKQAISDRVHFQILLG